MFFMERILITYSISVIAIESDFVFLICQFWSFFHIFGMSTYKHKVVLTLGSQLKACGGCQGAPPCSWTWKKKTFSASQIFFFFFPPRQFFLICSVLVNYTNNNHCEWDENWKRKKKKKHKGKQKRYVRLFPPQQGLVFRQLDTKWSLC